MSDHSVPLLDLTHGVAQRASTWRFELLDRDLQVIDELEVDRDQPPTLRVDTGRSVKRTLDGLDLDTDVIDLVDPIAHRLRVSMILEDETTWPQGIFLFSDASRVAVSLGIEVGSFNLVDQTLIVDQQASWSTSMGPGDVITDGIIQQLDLFPISYEIVESGAIVTPEQETLNWAAGTSRLQIINDLCKMIGYHELYFDHEGLARVGPMPNPETTPHEETLMYPIEQGRVYLGSIVRSNDLLELPNRFTVVNTGANQQSVWGVYDIPASAPHSAANRGFIVTHVEQVQGIETNQQAYDAARALARESRFAYETVEFSGPPDPRHDTYDVVHFEQEHFDPLAPPDVDPRREHFLETSWSYQLRDGAEMKHVLRRTYEAEAEDV